MPCHTNHTDRRQPFIHTSASHPARERKKKRKRKRKQKTRERKRKNENERRRKRRKREKKERKRKEKGKKTKKQRKKKKKKEKKKEKKKSGGFLLSRTRSTIGATKLNFSVRNGKRCPPPRHSRLNITHTRAHTTGYKTRRIRKPVSAKSRAISNARL